MRDDISPRSGVIKPDDGFSEFQIYSDVNRFLTFGLVLVLGFFVSWQLFPANPTGLALQFLFFAFLVLSLNNWMAALLLALVQIPLFLVPRMRWDPTATFTEILITFQLLLILALIGRLHSPIGRPSNLLKTLKQLFSSHSRDKLLREQSLSIALKSGRDFALATLGMAVSMLLVILLTAFLLQLIPLDTRFQEYSIRWARLKPEWFRLILLSGLLFLCVLVCWIVIAELNFRRISVREASMYLRSQIVGWMHRDFRLVVRKYRRRKRKNS